VRIRVRVRARVRERPRYNPTMHALPLVLALLASPDSLSPAEASELHASLTSVVEKWRRIPWKVDLLEARSAALTERKPLFLWSMNGHPLGCT
jgi:hypothetical protein